MANPEPVSEPVLTDDYNVSSFYFSEGRGIRFSQTRIWRNITITFGGYMFLSVFFSK